MNLDFPDDSESVVRSQLKAWMTEIEVLSRDPLVREFAELRQKIDDVDVSFDGAVAPSVPTWSHGRHPRRPRDTVLPHLTIGPVAERHSACEAWLASAWFGKTNQRRSKRTSPNPPPSLRSASKKGSHPEGAVPAWRPSVP